MKQKVLTPGHISFCPAFCCVIGNFTSSIQQIIHKGFLMVKSIVHRLFQPAPSCRLQCVQPAPEFIPDSRFFFLASLTSLFCWKSFVKTFQVKEAVTECDTLFGRKQLLICSSPFRRFRDLLFGIDIQQLQVFLTGFWDCLKKLTSAVGETAYQDNVLNPSVCSISIAVEQPGKNGENKFIPYPLLS